jgi:hypothetical protein
MKPTAAPAHFPYEHRSLAEVDRDHAESRREAELRFIMQADANIHQRRRA